MRNSVLGILLFSLIFSHHSCKEREKKAPNIVFIFADDLSYNAVGGLGNDVVKTPNIDKLISKGTTFSHAYNMGGWNGAVCVASRAMLMSGRAIWNAYDIDQKWRTNDKNAIDMTWPRIMQTKGYDTYMTGKWHVEAKADEIFNVARHIRPGMPKDLFPYETIRDYESKGSSDMAELAQLMPAGYNRPLSPNDQSWSAVDTSFGGFWAGGKHWSEVVRDDALDYMDMTVRSDNPFFMYLAFNAPHDPRQAPQKYLDMYPLEEVEVHDNFLPQYPYKDSIGNPWTLRDEALAPMPRTELAVKTHIREYYAIITHMDHQIGMILDKLQSMGELDNTYIFFSADHGLSVGRHGLIGKQNMYDHSMRVPLVVSGPDIPAGKVLSNEVYLQDVMATSLDIADIEKPNFVDFNSLLPALHGEATAHSLDEVYGCYMDHQRMIRKDGMKLIAYPRVKKLRLYDMKNDPLEMIDLSDDLDYTDIKKELLASLISLQEEMKDELDLESTFEDL